MAVLREIVYGAFREQDMAGIAAIHYSLCCVNPGASHIRALVYVDHFTDRPTVDSHPKFQFRMFCVGPCELECALRGRLRAIAKNQCHSITGRNSNQFSCSVPRTIVFKSSSSLLCSLINNLE